MTNTYPTISVVIATYNSAKTLEECLASVTRQDYPSKNIDIVVADGGSTDDTVLIAKKYHAKIVRITSSSQGAEYNRGVGARAAGGELLLFIDHDNILPHAGWLTRMVQPFLDDKTMVGAETMYYTYDAQDSMIGRYFSLFGANDIFAFYVGKADRLAHFYTHPDQYGVFRKAHVTEHTEYFTVDFSKQHIPTLGSNGFLIRRKLLFDHAKTSPDDFFHIDVNVDLIRNGYPRYAFTKDSLHHKTDERGLLDYLRRRKLFMEKYHFGTMSHRRYSLYERGDLGNTWRFVLLSLTIVIPVKDAIRGFLHKPDMAWFINPVMCFSLVILYGFAIIQRQITMYANNLLGK